MSCVEDTAEDTLVVNLAKVLEKSDVDSSGAPVSTSPLEYLVHSARTDEFGTALESFPTPKKLRIRSIHGSFFSFISFLVQCTEVCKNSAVLGLLTELLSRGQMDGIDD